MNPTLDTHEEQTSSVTAEEAVRVEPAVQKIEPNAKKESSSTATPVKKDAPSVHSAWQDVKKSWGKLFGAMRYNSVRALPAAIINNSSNFLGITHVLTEVMMFKASLKGGALVEKATGPIDYTIKAFKRVYSESLEGAKIKEGDFLSYVKSNPIKNTLKYVTDTAAATEREVALQAGVAREAIQLGNPWQTRSTVAGLIVWTLSALIPDKKESDTEVEQMVVLANTNKPAYVLERLRQAVWVPEWPSHKRQMIGLGIMTSGVCSTLAAWRDHIKTPEGPVYELNKAYLATGMITLASSLPLLFASDDQRGFGGFGSIMLGRLAFLPSSIAKKFKGNKNSAAWYTGAMTSFQAENMAQALIGGAEKLPDGSIIDHNELREHAKNKAQEVKQEKKSHSQRFESIIDGDPRNKITAVAEHQHAMPERVEAKKHEMTEATV